MPHVIEKAPTGRSKCRGCDTRIAAGLLRFGERLPNPFAEDGGEMTHWFHLACAAFKRPAPFLETVSSTAETIEDREMLEREAAAGIAHRRLSRVNTAERSSTGRAVCRSCQQTIVKDAWRITLVFYEDGRFVASGFIHVGCAQPYLETTDILRRVKHFTPSLTDADMAEIRAELDAGPKGPAST
jgi:hypothetical protein